MIYVAETFGNMTIIDAPNKRAALSIAKDRAAGMSMLRSDVQESHIRKATPEDVGWFRMMSGAE